MSKPGSSAERMVISIHEISERSETWLIMTQGNQIAPIKETFYEPISMDEAIEKAKVEVQKYGNYHCAFINSQVLIIEKDGTEGYWDYDGEEAYVVMIDGKIHVSGTDPEEDVQPKKVSKFGKRKKK